MSVYNFKIEERKVKGAFDDVTAVYQERHGKVNQQGIYIILENKHGPIIKDTLTKDYESEKCLVELTAILKEASNNLQQTEDKREKIQALPLAKECYSLYLELPTKSTVVNDAIKFQNNHLRS